MWNRTCPSGYRAPAPTGHAPRAWQPPSTQWRPSGVARFDRHECRSNPSRENAPTGHASRHGRPGQLSQGEGRGGVFGTSRRQGSSRAPRYACHRPQTGSIRSPIGERYTRPARRAQLWNGAQGGPSDGMITEHPRVRAHSSRMLRHHRSSGSGPFAEPCGKPDHSPGPAFPTSRTARTGCSGGATPSSDSPLSRSNPPRSISPCRARCRARAVGMPCPAD